MNTEDEYRRVVEALLFVAKEPLGHDDLAKYLPEGVDIGVLVQSLVDAYSGNGFNLVPVAGGWVFQTAPDLAYVLREHAEVERKLSRAAVETLAIIAYHQPVTRAEIEQIRGVAVNKGTIDTLFDAGWIQTRGRRRTPGRPVLWGTTKSFLEHFGLNSLNELPGVEELKAAGLLDADIVHLGPSPRDAEAGVLPEPIEEDEAPIDEQLTPGDAESDVSAAG